MKSLISKENSLTMIPTKNFRVLEGYDANFDCIDTKANDNNKPTVFIERGIVSVIYPYFIKESMLDVEANSFTGSVGPIGVGDVKMPSEISLYIRKCFVIAANYHYNIANEILGISLDSSELVDAMDWRSLDTFEQHKDTNYKLFKALMEAFEQVVIEMRKVEGHTPREISLHEYRFTHDESGVSYAIGINAKPVNLEENADELVSDIVNQIKTKCNIC